MTKKAFDKIIEGLTEILETLRKVELDKQAALQPTYRERVEENLKQELELAYSELLWARSNEKLYKRDSGFKPRFSHELSVAELSKIVTQLEANYYNTLNKHAKEIAEEKTIGCYSS